MTILKRVRTTVWETSDGRRWPSRAEAELEEKVFRLASFTLLNTKLQPGEAADFARQLVLNREGFVIALLPTHKEQR